MQPAAVALDIQALQDGSGAAPAATARAAALARRLIQADRLAAALIAPELPPPAGLHLPSELTGAGAALLRWDCRSEARRLLAGHGRLVHVVADPLLYTGPGDPAGLVVSRHWADSGVARVVVLDGVAAAALAAAAPESRAAARLEWIRGSSLVVLDDPDPVAGVEPLGLDPARVAGPDDWLDRLDDLAPESTRAALVVPEALAPRIALVGPFPPEGGGLGVYNARFAEAAAASGVTVDVVCSVTGPDRARTRVGLVHPDAFGTDERPASYDGPVYTIGNSDGHLATVETALRHPGWLWLHEARLPAVATTALTGLDDEAFARQMEHLLELAYPGRTPWPAARRAGRSHLALARAGVGLTALLVRRAAGVFVNSEAARAALILDQPPMAALPPIVVLPPACPPVRPGRAARIGPGAADSPLAVAFGVVSMGKRPDLLIDAAARTGCRLAFVGPCPDILIKVIADRAATRGISAAVQVTGPVDDDTWWAWMDRATVAVQMRDSSGGEMSAAVLDALAAGVPVVTNLASAADYPPGTVDLLDQADPTADALAGRLAALLGDPERRGRLSDAAAAFASAHQMNGLVEAVATALTGPPH
jgi:glycosyltransferase involved in cell wall biosynthesis